jgi:hypothetical protein
VSLRCYGRVVAQSDGPSFRVRWSEDGQVLSWDEGSLSLHQFRSIAHDVLRRAAAAADQLMYGWDPAYDLATIKDKMANTARGYSFVSEPANGLSEAYLALSQRASLASMDGLLSKDGWLRSRVWRYLQQSEALLSLLLVLVYLTGGQAARGTELTSVEHCNGASTQRGIYVHGGAFVLVTRHNKSRLATNKEFQVARFLPSGVGKLLYLYLVYIRPFTNMLERTDLAANETEESSVLFASPSRPDLPWATGKLSKELAGATNRLLGQAINAQLYRQLSIAMTEKHVRHISRPFDRQDDRSPNAPMESAFAWQSGHRPAQRASTYGLDGAYPDQLQPGLLQSYKWVSEEWHRFLQLDSFESHPAMPRPHPQTDRPVQGGHPGIATGSTDKAPGTSHKRQPPSPRGDVIAAKVVGSRPNKCICLAGSASNTKQDPVEHGQDTRRCQKGPWMQPDEEVVYSPTVPITTRITPQSCIASQYP